MPYAVVTYFDPPTERAVRAIWDDLAAQGISRDVPAAQIRPHITLAVYDDLIAYPVRNIWPSSSPRCKS
jgi:hypothetical protein